MEKQTPAHTHALAHTLTIHTNLSHTHTHTRTDTDPHAFTLAHTCAISAHITYRRYKRARMRRQTTGHLLEILIRAHVVDQPRELRDHTAPELRLLLVRDRRQTCKYVGAGSSAAPYLTLSTQSTLQRLSFIWLRRVSKRFLLPNASSKAARRRWAADPPPAYSPVRPLHMCAV